MKVNCEFCGALLDPGSSSAMKQVVCWAEPGKRSGIKLISNGAGWAHRLCVEVEERARKGHFTQTESLF
jgi:hypothetical protein